MWTWAGRLHKYSGLLLLFLGTSCLSARSDRVFQRVLCLQSPLLSVVCLPLLFLFCVRVTFAHFVCVILIVFCPPFFEPVA